MKEKDIYSVKSKLILVLLFSFLTIGSNLLAQTNKTITFTSEDSVTVTADLYIAHDETATFIIFFHQAGWSRGEYIEIAPKINKLGFNAMAVDQRSGGKVNNVINQTHKDAKNKGKATKYHHAIPDMEAAIKYVSENYQKAKIIIWGSSYSSALVLKLAGDNPKKIDGVLSFSPGEYFGRFGEGDDFISKSVINIKCPVFVTSAKNEENNWKAIFDVIPTKNKQSFLPKGSGHHGSRALWESKKGFEEYWQAVEAFLKVNF